MGEMARSENGKNNDSKRERKKLCCPSMLEVFTTYHRRHEIQRKISRVRGKKTTRNESGKKYEESVKSALRVQLVKRRGVKRKKKDSFREGRWRGRERRMSRKG